MSIMWKMRLHWVLAALAVAVVVGRSAGTEKQAYSRRTPIVEAVQKTRHSIVTVKVPQAGSRDTVGTGVIVDESGTVITNRHVVGGARSVKVRLFDGTEVTAGIVATEPSWDLAVLQIATKRELSALTLAPVSDLMVGETVIAVGHPFGYTNTVSTGIISALGREITMPTGDVLTDLIQTDASINPGNSGGPLLNINGELIGINVALRDGAQGIAFAIKADTVKKVLAKHVSARKVAGVNHGLSCREKVLGETGPRQRVVVAACAPAACDALKQGDEILAVGTRAVANTFDLERALWDKTAGEKVPLTVVRNGKELTVQLTLLPGAAGAPPAKMSTATSQHSTLAADRIRNLTTGERK
jgi:serine protease Do